ncbi:MAG: cbb3-type cytochrome c oxidase subunit I [Proteobacteria bacterium]|nr:cbb3-type cytochrome c oxidase subunit I [Pseudomonadota bacterium]
MNKHTKRFIASALIYFFIGCTIGLISIIKPELVGIIKPVHVHINLLGWVTMMIIGVSYFVIPLFIRKNVYSDRLVTLHFILANAGIIGMVLSFIQSNNSLLAVAAIIEVLASYLFLFNIISTAIKGEPFRKLPQEGKFLMAKNDKEVDRWASYFTIVSTLYFVAGCTLGGVMALFPEAWNYKSVHFHINLFGWISMMIYGVAYHIFPRFSGIMVKNRGLVKVNFILANAGLVSMIFALLFFEWSGGSFLSNKLILLSALIESAAGVLFIYNVFPSVSGSSKVMGKAAVKFVLASLLYLAVGLILGLIMALSQEILEQIMPVHVHLHVLGWITMMIYGVGYYIIPSFAGKKLFSQSLATFQFWTANVGLIGMLSFFYFIEEMRGFTIFFASLEFSVPFLFIVNIAASILKKD